MSATRPIVTCDMTVSLDGFYSGPEHMDEGFRRIVDWIHQAMAWRERYGKQGGDDLDADAVVRTFPPVVGAFVMGRGMFDVGEEPWGDEPPFGAPVFVVTSRERDPLVKTGTTFHFVTDGPARAIELAREAAGERNVHISGGGTFVRTALGADLIDELRVDIAPVLLGDGMPLFAGVTPGRRQLEIADVAHSERVVHLTYRLVDRSQERQE